MDERTENLDPATNQIAETRSEMAETIEAIKEKLDPSRLVNQAKGTIRETVVERAEQTIGAASDAIKERAGRVVDSTKEMFSRTGEPTKGDEQSMGESAKEAANGISEKAASMGAGIADAIARNPMPAAVTGLGLIWLVLSARANSPEAGVTAQPLFEGAEDSAGSFGESNRGAGGDGMNGIRAKAGEVAGAFSDSASALAARTQEQAHMAKSKLSQTLRDRPFTVGIAAALFGMVVGLMVPETPRENRLMGPTRDRLAAQAGQSVKATISAKVDEVARTVGQKVENVTHDVLGV